jgi:hypothetical protein
LRDLSVCDGKKVMGVRHLIFVFIAWLIYYAVGTTPVAVTQSNLALLFRPELLRREGECKTHAPLFQQELCEQWVINRYAERGFR